MLRPLRTAGHACACAGVGAGKALENQADATRAAGEQNADATREGADADGNSAN